MNTNRPGISIGLPVYNGEMYLAETIESLLSQTFSDFELVIFDNASTDQTQQICLGFAARDKRIRYYRNERNLGAAKNYNLTFENSNGEYFKWVAYDDPLAPEFLEKCLEVLEHQEKVVICYPKTKIINEHGEVVENYVDGLHLCQESPAARFIHILENHGLCNPIFGLIRRSILEKTPLIGSYPYADLKLLAELSLHGHIYEIGEYLFYRREHPLVSTTVNKTELEIARWYNTDTRGKFSFSIWRRYLEYLSSVSKAPVSITEKYLCIMYLIRKAWAKQRWKMLLSELWGNN